MTGKGEKTQCQNKVIDALTHGTEAAMTSYPLDNTRKLW